MLRRSVYLSEDSIMRTQEKAATDYYHPWLQPEKKNLESQAFLPHQKARHSEEGVGGCDVIFLFLSLITEYFGSHIEFCVVL